MGRRTSIGEMVLVTTIVTVVLIAAGIHEGIVTCNSFSLSAAVAPLVGEVPAAAAPAAYTSSSALSLLPLATLQAG